MKKNRLEKMIKDHNSKVDEMNSKDNLTVADKMDYMNSLLNIGHERNLNGDDNND